MLYRTLYRPLGIEFQLALLVPYPDWAPRALALNRRDTPFSEGDRQLLARGGQGVVADYHDKQHNRRSS
jgi:hypothetical protein